MIETPIIETEQEQSIIVSNGIYARHIKRPTDIFLSFCAITVLSPIFLILIIVGAIFMKGTPFFVQERVGRNENIFKLIKFRTMTCEKGNDGKLLPDEKRLTSYGKFLRSTSLDELPELINILKGDMSIVGPRPLLPKYLPYYTETERHRHDVRPGLTGLAQVNGRNSIVWEKKFILDIKYIKSVSLLLDISIIYKTVKCVFMRSDIGERGQGILLDFDTYRQEQNELEKIV